ncbi:hypothetical protein Dbac_1253 [Desulfomicrobium baculatum DSM 4028]|uniref:Uncharacterized protein n=1 Tax=Desulfomicrobium baculatum (strain DSM 4028 / VKM B-1378 / X) TaxID=525897 RepID=C7LRX3_DESBD|nr:hypothetical protein Dbac_1253 [Desulfomicrobium baculatum DSM 4028]
MSIYGDERTVFTELLKIYIDTIRREIALHLWNGSKKIITVINFKKIYKIKFYMIIPKEMFYNLLII